MAMPPSRTQRVGTLMRQISVVIPGGGIGKRMGRKTPKQFLRLGGMTILERTVRVFHSLPEVGEIVLVVPAPFVARARRMKRLSGLVKIAEIVPGGKKRQESVYRGLAACRMRGGLVLIHDAVRPLVEPGLIRDVIRQARRTGAALAAVEVKDTVKAQMPEHPGFTRRTLPRETLWAAQTPQGFRFDLIWQAHKSALRSGFIGTDEASLVERIGHPVKIVRGNERNIKVTTPADRHWAEFFLKRPF